MANIGENERKNVNQGQGATQGSSAGQGQAKSPIQGQNHYPGRVHTNNAGSFQNSGAPRSQAQNQIHSSNKAFGGQPRGNRPAGQHRNPAQVSSGVAINQMRTPQPQAENLAPKASGEVKSFLKNKENQGNQANRQGFRSQHTPSRFDPSRAKIEETVENIQQDITRIEKEIELEIREIQSLKL